MGSISFYKVRLIAFVLIFVLFSLITLGLVSYQKVTGIIEEEMGMRAAGVAQAAAHIIQVRIEEYLQINAPDDMEKEFYREMSTLFREFKASNKLKYMYTERMVDENTVIYILDAEEPGSEFASAFGDADEMNGLRRKAYASGQAEFGPLTVDPFWGTYITGYAPLFYPDGSLAGLVGADIEADEVLKLFNEIKFIIILTITVVFLLIFAVTYKMAGLMTKPLFVDGLTGVYNHKYFQESLASEIEFVKRYSGDLSVIMLDLDNFKYINDTYGHRFGDLVLASVAKVFRDSVRKSDVVARYGGEEFAAIMRAADLESAFALASRVRNNVENSPVVFPEGGTGVTVTVSVGVAQWKPGISKNELIDMADKAMYASKQKSRNTVSVYLEDEHGSFEPAG